MAVVTLEEAKKYLRVDYPDEDDLIASLLSGSTRLCADAARITEDEWMKIESEQDPDESVKAVQETMKVAVLYCLAYLFEHREDADHHALTLTLRSLLFGIRKEAF